MNKEKRIAILTRLRDENPHPTTELNFNSPFELLIAVLLSAQATDVSVNKATALLYPVANTPQAMLELGVEGVKSYIKTIGLFNSKAENVIKTCRILLEQHGGEVPEDRAALEALPNDRCRYPYLPRFKPHQLRPRQKCRAGRREAAQSGSRRI